MRALTFFARRFVAGDELADAIKVVRRLNGDGLKATLDSLGEDSRSHEQVEAAVVESLEILRVISDSGVDSNLSLKLTQIGLVIDAELAQANLARIAEEAASVKNFVRVDMEGSAWTQQTLDIVNALHARGLPVGVVLQACLRRTEADCRDAAAKGLRVRLCKGAYKEPVDIAFAEKSEVNDSYDRCAVILAETPQPAFATHDDERISAAKHACATAGMEKDGYELQMLYGLRAKRWRELRAQGHVVRIYVPYGRKWLPYFYRRLRERKENLAFVLRNLFS